ncbi:glucose 1-dehydrogenase [Sphingomonas sp.]|uniref:glucose 1-dehydrogenase n=1 Tax=Sphingomonas sp. TaxID=28214 RepID=UPI0025E9910E|nr:glucose 1-dehydrogenase [Sphingomonas sp.]
MLNRRTVLITGAARGQGAAAARLVVEAGGRVIVSDIRVPEGEAIATELGAAATFVRHDVGDENDWRHAIEIATQMGGLHGLVNNAGVLLTKGLRETTLDEWQKLVRVNQTSCFLGMRAAAPLIEQSGGGSIVNISSIAGLRGSARNFAYGATKWAMRGMTRAAAVDLAPRGIRVNGIYPGSIDTEMLSMWTPERRAEWLQRVPLGRMAEPSEVAHLVLFLLSDESRFITGAEIAVDGGSSAT